MGRQRYLNSQPGALESEFAQRSVAQDLQDAGIAALGELDSKLEEVYVTIPVNDGSGWQSTCQVIRPKTPSRDRKRTLIVMFHGGMFHLGSPEALTRPGRQFALEYDTVFVSVEYRLAPEYTWPVAIMDGYDVCAYLAEAAISGNSNIFGESVEMNTTTFVIGGTSAGANIACAVLNLTLMNQAGENMDDVRLQRIPLRMPVKGVYLGIPLLQALGTVPKRYADVHTSHLVDQQAAAWLEPFWQTYNPNFQSPMCSPINATDETLSRWPRTYIQVGETDSLRDDGIILETALRHNGVQVKLDRCPSLDHVTWSVLTATLRENIESELRQKSMAAMQWLLKEEQTVDGT